MEIPGHSDSKESAYNARDLGSVPESERSLGEGNDYLLQDSYLENSMDRETWWAMLQGSILSPYLFNLYAEYIMWNVGLDEVQAGIKTAGRNINNFRYADDTTLMAENKELKSLLMKVKEESAKIGLKFNIKKMNIMASSPIISWQIDGETMETVRDFIFWATKSLQMVTAVMKLKDACSLEEKLWSTWIAC